MAVGVGVSVPADLEGECLWENPPMPKLNTLLSDSLIAPRPSKLPPRAWPCAGFVGLHSTNGASVLGRLRVGGAPSPAMLVAVCDGGPSEGRRLQRLDARRLLVAHDEGAVA